MTLDFIIIFLIAYLIGSIPFGLILTRMAGLGDIRKVGSGNIGATNVMRTGHKGLGIATLLLDAGKGALAVILCLYYAKYILGTNESTVGLMVYNLAGFAVVFGHIFPVWLKFKGGKGVATTLGVMTIALWAVSDASSASILHSLRTFILMLFLGFGVWLFVFCIGRMSSLASLCQVWAYAAFSLYILSWEWPELTIKTMWMPLALAILITYTHRSNIKRIIAGTEKGFRKEKI